VGIYASFAGHIQLVAYLKLYKNAFFHGRPHFPFDLALGGLQPLSSPQEDGGVS